MLHLNNNQFEEAILSNIELLASLEDLSHLPIFTKTHPSQLYAKYIFRIWQYSHIIYQYVIKLYLNISPFVILRLKSIQTCYDGVLGSEC